MKHLALAIALLVGAATMQPAAALQLVTGALAASGNSATFALATPQLGSTGAVDVAVWGTFTNFSAQLQCTYDGGTTWINVGAAITTTGKFIVTIGAESGVSYRLAVTGSVPTGTFNYRVGQS